MNTVLLETFVAVMQTLSVSQAALDLHVTQPAVTKRIQQLEEALGTNLFHLVGRKLQPTVQAIELLPTARRWLKEYRTVQTRLQHENSAPAGLLRIGTSHHIGLHHLEPLLRQYVTRYPEVRLEIRFVDSEEGYDLVREGELEAVFITFPPEPDPHLSYLPIWQEQLYVTVSNLHPLAVSHSVTLEQLADFQAILPRPHTYTTRLVLQAFEDKNIRLPLLNTNNSLEAIRMLVGVGLGWSALPENLCTDHMRRLEITPDISFQRTLGLIWPDENRPLLPAQAALVELCRSCQAPLRETEESISQAPAALPAQGSLL